MVKVLLIVLFSCVIGNLGTAAQSTSPAPEPGSYYSVEPAFEYSRLTGALTDHDFRNIELNIFDQQGRVQLKAKLKNGIFEDSGLPKNWVAINGISYFGFEEQKPRFALVSFLWVSTGADASSHGGVQLFMVQNKWLTVVQQVLFTTKHFGAGAIFDPATRTLLINSSHYTRIDPHCCPSQQDVVRFDWRDHNFVQSGSKILPVARGSMRIR